MPKKSSSSRKSSGPRKRVKTHPDHKFIVERVQTGVRMEKRLIKVLKGLAEYLDMTLGDVLESIVLHAFDGKCAFGKPTIEKIKVLKEFYGLDLDADAVHHMVEKE